MDTLYLVKFKLQIKVRDLNSNVEKNRKLQNMAKENQRVALMKESSE